MTGTLVPFAAGMVPTAAELNANSTTELNAVRCWVAKASGTDQSGISAATDVTGLSVTWTADASRIYKYTVCADLAKTTAGTAQLTIANSSNGSIILTSVVMANADLTPVCLSWTETGLSGSTTRKVRLDCSPGTVGVTNSFSRNAIFIVEDVGPA